jgi:UDP-N-acetylglucosamine 4,6-dehydratase/5-epimerase
MKDSVVLITGGTGSFGRGFVASVLEKRSPRKVIVFSRDELKQSEMRQDSQDDRLRFFIGDVRDVDRLRRAMSGVDIVVHAAALKQVATCEYNPMEAILTNVMGARSVIEASLDCGVKKVIALSTDKAVNPVNLYGATKLCAEKLFVQSNSYVGLKETRFSCVRYGNVLGSRGSVVPLFQRQRASGKVTITDSRMTRFWITLDQGVEFVLQCIDLMEGGEVFVPKIPSTSLMDLKNAVAPECDVEYIGVQPGEKLHEVLISEDEAPQVVELESMYVIQPTNLSSLTRKLTWSQKGKVLSDGFCYRSDRNPQALSADEMKALFS